MLLKVRVELGVEEIEAGGLIIQRCWVFPSHRQSWELGKLPDAFSMLCDAKYWAVGCVVGKQKSSKNIMNNARRKRVKEQNGRGKMSGSGCGNHRGLLAFLFKGAFCGRIETPKVPFGRCKAEAGQFPAPTSVSHNEQRLPHLLPSAEHERGVVHPIIKATYKRLPVRVSE